ncbi:hypothetical protein SLEP1_g18237 [Rubroshorea leprosula]|uniref:Uncharacterized protein n=1 Tax=Rubroshorea leprosula TaxID=152421 RepID=A0AAV5IWT5_9ROSI|nr:hypothetical protein SLEP1_g18237 [Rubroshorea leprosula]
MEDMSSRETMSVGGSEEVRMMEEVSLETELSRSKRMVEERGGEEVVEGEGIPMNILEVVGECERCYNVEANIVSEVMWPAEVKERACSAPRDHWMPIYAHYLSAGLRFPILESLVSLDAVEAAELYGVNSLSSLFDTKSMTVAKRFTNSTFLEVDYHRAREKVLSHGGVGIVKHVLEAASLMNALSQKFFETLKESNVLAKEKEDLGKKKEKVEKDLVEAILELMRLQEENDSLKTKLMFEERKRKICEDKIAV